MENTVKTDTICALATPRGVGAIAMIRLTGNDAFAILEKVFSKRVSDKQSHTVHFGNVLQGEEIIDEVVVILYKNPKSFTGEDMVEITCHASPYIEQRLLELLLANGCRMAGAGEFSMRAYLNGKMDLSQAEAIADLIASENAAAHHMAMNQMKGGFAKVIRGMREKLIHFASMIELELDFGEEDVEFANREELKALVKDIYTEIDNLASSFALGNILKNGVPVTIAGAPNVGKSTLLNNFLNEERAIVSSIAGTTRDTIEDTIHIDGVEFRFIDTAGIRDTEDEIEQMGIDRTMKKIDQAAIILYLLDATEPEISESIAALRQITDKLESGKLLIPVINKIDLADPFSNDELPALLQLENALAVSAKSSKGMPELKEALLTYVRLQPGHSSSVIVSNARHHRALLLAKESMERVNQGLKEGLPSDLIAMDIRQCMHYLSEITGEISTEDLLGNIFSSFCIGK